VPEGEDPVTRSDLVRGLAGLGVRRGAILMVHTSMSSLGWVVGGERTVIDALLEVLRPDGTLMAFVGWDENPYYLDRWPERWRRAYLDELPAYDPVRSEADRSVGRIPDRLRTWPGAVRSSHPEANVAAVGARATWIAEPHPGDFPQGPGSPLARLVEAEGQILMLGAPLETLTILHHAETLARGRDKRFVTYRMPVLEDGAPIWRTYRDIDTSSDGAFPYDELALGEDAFETIGREALAAGVGRSGQIGASTSHLFEAARLVRFAVAWIEERFPPD
jgi:aminoglycoside 3-N-acetyltransferase